MAGALSRPVGWGISDGASDEGFRGEKSVCSSIAERFGTLEEG